MATTLLITLPYRQLCDSCVNVYLLLLLLPLLLPLCLFQLVDNLMKFYRNSPDSCFRACLFWHCSFIKSGFFGRPPGSALLLVFLLLFINQLFRDAAAYVRWVILLGTPANETVIQRSVGLAWQTKGINLADWPASHTDFVADVTNFLSCAKLCEQWKLLKLVVIGFQLSSQY